ncbi:hydroxysqualene dehydroxylase [Halorussus lipolyticus]|uniref:hydroxysqualene dehydroxylase n=1 Tax=Halorussus lipolyticus TaxID=3034024 RepID=UPI0023E87C58|nr:NAD(P)/FAD-dependent oxidoreductase [Halorussus sp. DT80]
MNSGNEEDVLVVGGGLAGMTAAYELQRRGCDTTIVEATDRLGGKAGASMVDGNVEEHGYHIFPEWYENVWRIVDELGIRDNFEGVSDFHQLRDGDHPNYRTFRNLTSARYLFHNLRAGVMSPTDMFLFFYASLDLMSQPYRRRDALDQITINGFLKSRFYGKESVAKRFQDLILKGISVPTYDVSAMTMRNMMRYWARNPLPMHSILRTDLQSGLIDPFEERLRELGCDIEKETPVVELVPGEEGIESVVVETEDDGRVERSAESVVLAVPVEKAVDLVDDDLHEAAPELSNLKYLDSRPMAALHVHFDRKLPEIPRDHVNLLGSEYGLSYVDVSQWWNDEDDDGTVLNLIASDYETLRGLDDETATSELLDDLRPYLPDFDDDEVRTTYLQPHDDEPLFMNEVGIWKYRPGPTTSLSNLYLAGDYCRSHADLVSMEGAVTTGLHAANAVRADRRLDRPVNVRKPDTYPRELLVLGRLLLAPLALVARLVSD